MPRRFCFALSVLLLVATQTSAGASSPPGKSASATLACTDFRHDADGSWRPLHPVNVAGVPMWPGVSFREGNKINGLDVAARLDRQCLRH